MLLCCCCCTASALLRSAGESRLAPMFGQGVKGFTLRKQPCQRPCAVGAQRCRRKPPRFHVRSGGKGFTLRKQPCQCPCAVGAQRCATPPELDQCQDERPCLPRELGRWKQSELKRARWDRPSWASCGSSRGPPGAFVGLSGGGSWGGLDENPGKPGRLREPFFGSFRGNSKRLKIRSF